MYKKMINKKNSVIFGVVLIAIIAIWAFVGANSPSDIENKVNEINKLSADGNNREAKIKFKELMSKVDELNKAGKTEEAKELFKKIMDEKDKQRKIELDSKNIEENQNDSDSKNDSVKENKNNEFNFWDMNPFPDKTKKAQNLDENNQLEEGKQ